MEQETSLKEIPNDDQGSPESIVNTNSILEKIANLYAEQLMSDIILVVGGIQYPAHRVILCASSEVFQVMLMNPEWNECRKRIIELYEEPYCAAVFPQFLKYLYVGQMKATLQSVMPVLALADKYNVEDLVKQCIAFMLSHTAKAATQGYLVSWLQYATTYNPYHKDLTDALKRFIKWNLEMVGESTDFVELDTQIMILLLQQNDVVVKSEYILFGILQKWLLHRKDMLDNEENMQPEEKDMIFKQLIESTVSHIRFAMMSPRELAHLLLYPLLAYHKEYIVQRMAIGMSYHSGQEDRINEIRKSEWGSLQFTPRLYSNDLSSVSFCIKDIFQIPDYTNFVACFFSPRNLAEGEDDQSVTWDVEFFPRGVKYEKAKMVWGEELPEFSLRTVRMRVTCQENCLREERFKVAVLMGSMQHEISYVLTVVERTEYFSDKCRVLNLDNLLPYDDVKKETVRSNPHFTGPQKNNINIQVIIAPMGPYTSREAPPFEFKQ